MDNDPESPLTDQERDVLFGVGATPEERPAPEPYALVRPRYISQYELLELRTLLDKTAAALEQDWGTMLRDRIRVSIRQIQSSNWSDLFSVFGIEPCSTAQQASAEQTDNSLIGVRNRNERFLRLDDPNESSLDRDQDNLGWQVSWLSSRELTWGLPLIFPGSLLSNIFDRLLGGVDDPRWDNRLGAPLTALEQRLFCKTVESFCIVWQRSWSEIIPLTFDPVRCTKNLLLDDQNTLDQNDPIAVCELSFVWKGMDQSFYLALPYYSLNNIQRQMVRARRNLLSQKTLPPLESIHPGIRHARVHITAELARATMTAGEFTQIRVGDILTTEQPADAPIAVLVEGTPKFQAHIGQYRGCKAIQIDNPNS